MTPGLIKFSISRGLLSFICAAAVAFALYWAGAIAGGQADSEALTPISLPWTFFGIVIFAPLLETLIMAGFFRALFRFVNVRLAAVFSGFIMAAGHSILYWAWGLIVLIPFIIYSAPFASSHIPFKEQVTKSCLTHVVHNTLVFILIAITTLNGLT